MGSDSSSDRLAGLLEPVVRAGGLDLEEVRITPAGRRRILRVIVDGDDGVGLDDVAEVSQAVSKVLDESDAMGAGPYVLEVTSPGIDRPLTAERHWRRAQGRMVKATLRDGKMVEGRVTAADDDGVELTPAGKPPKGGARSRRYAYAALARGRVQVEFRHADAGDRG